MYDRSEIALRVVRVFLPFLDSVASVLESSEWELERSRTTGMQKTAILCETECSQRFPGPVATAGIRRRGHYPAVDSCTERKSHREMNHDRVLLV
jgi:hypothetical protein